MSDLPPHALGPAARLNSHGEMEFEMEGVTYLLRPSREAIEEIEAATDRALIELAEGAQLGRLTLKDQAAIVVEFLKAWGREAGPDGDPNQIAARQFKPDGVKDFIIEAGVVIVNSRLAVILAGAVGGGYDRRGKATAAWAKALVEAGAKKKTRAAA
ncbi:GTA-gp10 family protein [Sandarakinorhabdus sp.]|uniref:GTA-gp10 family protein n=1 Tax=Sandarakinorhabdus sp. TaxID=1916663 RepID=UPI00286DB8DA|nr:GTA-gp10 family protein [Sandarakinorhabdus sp.]